MKEITARTAACSCGQLRITVSGDPARVSICHCLACQRRTGSVFGAQARFRRADAVVVGASSEYRRTGDSGGAISFHFCPKCGATVYYAIDAYPDLVAVPVGAFADPNFPQPRFSVYEERRHDWVRLPEGIERD